MTIQLYSTGCPKCNVLKKKLDMESISYETITDTNKIIEICEITGIFTMPILKIEDSGATKIYNFRDAIKWIGDYNAN